MPASARLTVFAALLGLGVSGYVDSAHAQPILGQPQSPHAASEQPIAPYAVPQQPIAPYAGSEQPIAPYATPQQPIAPYAVPVAPPPTNAPPATAPDAPRASVAAIMMASGQALLWDNARGQYVLVKAGDSFEDYRVSAITGEQVVLSRSNQHFVLPRTTDTSELTKRHPSATQAGTSAGELVDPYGAAPAGPLSPSLPAATPNGATPNRVSPAAVPDGAMPIDPYAAGASAPTLVFTPSPSTLTQPAQAPRANASAGSDVMDPYAVDAAAPLFASPPATGERPPPLAGVTLEPSNPAPASHSEALGEERRTLSRREFDAALADFPSLGKDIKVAQVGEGIRITQLAPNSLPFRMGMRAGDVVLDVDGQKLRNMNDAASIYARLMDAEEFSVTIRRSGNLMTLRYQFR